MRRGLGSVHLLRGALEPQMTREQRIRGVDIGVDCALLITGYSQDALAALAQVDLSSDQLEEHGASGVTTALYRTDYSLTASEIDV